MTEEQISLFEERRLLIWNLSSLSEEQRDRLKELDEFALSYMNSLPVDPRSEFGILLQNLQRNCPDEFKRLYPGGL